MKQKTSGISFMSNRQQQFRIWCSLTLLLTSIGLGQAQAEPTLSFVYVHGVNNHGENSQQIIYDKFARLHQNLMRSFEREPLSPAILGIQSTAEIEDIPEIFYWYEMSQDAVKSLDNDLSSVWDVFKKKKKGPGLAARVQNNIAAILQDAFWLINENNQIQINESLNAFIKKKVPPNNKIVLFGYSGGAIIDFNYLLNYLPYIDLYASGIESQHNKELPETLVEQFKEPQLRHTCLQALLDTQIARYDNRGDLVMFLDHLNLGTPEERQSLRNRYILQNLPALREANQNVCLPANRLKGVVTFGSPVAALSARSLKSLQGYLYLGMSRFLIEKNIFWLNLNRINDPLGYSIPSTLIENELQKKFDLNLYGEDRGFIFNNVLFQNRVFFYKAHLWYLRDPMIFSNAIVDSLKMGYQQHLIDPATQPQ